MLRCGGTVGMSAVTNTDSALGGSASFTSRLKQFDAYPKTSDDFRVRTFTGATGELPD